MRVVSRPTGFTLIELMVVVAIIGLLASAALPAFTTLQLKAKRTERTINTTNFMRAVKDFYTTNNSQWPAAPGYGISASWVTYFYTPMNPSWAAPTGLKRPFDATLPIWNQLNFSPDGWVRYNYFMEGVSWPGSTPYLYIWTQGDLDADNVINDHYQYWYLENNGNWYLAWDYPDDSSGPW